MTDRLRHRDRGCGPQRADRRVLPRPCRPAHPGARTPRASSAALRDRGDRAGRPRLDDLLHREHAAARASSPTSASPNAGCGWSRASRGCRSCSRTPGAAVVVDARTHRRRRSAGSRRHDADAFGRVTERSPRARPLRCSRSSSRSRRTCTRRGWSKLREGRRLFRRFRHLSGDQLSDLVRFATGLARRVRRTALRVRRGPPPRTWRTTSTGCTAPPYRPGTAIGLLFHMLSGGEHHIQGFNGHVIGGMGSITQAMASAVRDAGAEIRTDAEVARIDVRDGRATGVTLEDGTEIAARTVLSNADPKRTFLGLVEKSQLRPRTSRRRRGDRDGGPVREGELRAGPRSPAWHGMPEDAGPEPAVARDARADARGRPADVRPAPMGRDPGRALGGLRGPRRTWTTRSRPPGARHDGVRAVRAVRAAVGHLGRAARRARAQGRRTISRYSDNVRHVDPARCRSSRRWTSNAPTG